jgi:uncharacterized protein YabE (DUF348 family)
MDSISSGVINASKCEKMKKIFYRSTVSIGALGIALLVVILTLIISVSNITHADNGKSNITGKLITIYDQGTEKVIVTQSATIGDALKEAGVLIDTSDIVEPSLDQQIIASDYQVNIYRARPILIVDGNNRIKILSAYQTPQQIVTHAGIKTYDEDIVSLGQTDDIFSEGIGLKLTITRATSFDFTLFGKNMTTRSTAKTVGEMLAEKGIKLLPADKVSVDLLTPLAEGLSVKVWREGKQTITIDESIDFDVEYIEDADQMVSYRSIRSAGEKGSRSVSYEVTIVNDVESSRTEIASIITKQPKKQTEVIGVKGKYSTPSENENIVWDYLINQGLSKIQVAGIMGNLQQEHQFRTDGDGLAQWIGGRREKLYTKPYPTNIYTQLDFLMEELNGGYLYVLNNIKSSNSLAEVTQIFQNQFERCNPYYCMFENRVNYARNILASH